jgi:hypothetical protein
MSCTTKVEKNVPVEDCQGWIIVLMERASRFIWALEFFYSILSKFQPDFMAILRMSGVAENQQKNKRSP